EPDGPGLSDWLAAGDEVPDDGMARLEIDAPRGVRLLPRGTLPLDAAPAPSLAEHLVADPRPVVADCGTLARETAPVIARRGGVREAVKARVRARLLDEGLQTDLAGQVAVLVQTEGPLLGDAARRGLVAEVVGDVAGLGPLEPLLADPDVTEVMVNGPAGVWI